MKVLIPILIGLLVVGCGKKDDANTGVVNPNKPSPKAVPVNIADPIVEKAIRKELKKPTGELTKADLEKVMSLNLFQNKLTEVPKGLEKLTKLEWVNLHDNQLTSAKGLEKLTQLTTLDLKDNQLTELPKGLEKCTQLTTLDLQDNQLTDVKGLEKLTQLTWLRLNYNQLTEVNGLEKLTQLKELYLNNNKLTDVTGLEKLTQLERLILSNNQLTDVKGLEKLTQLKALSLAQNPDLTKAQIAELQKALPNCKIVHNAKK